MRPRPYQLVVLRRAQRNIDAVAVKWRAENEDRPSAFLDELVAAYERICMLPESGAAARGQSGYRYVILPVTRHDLFYRADHAAGRVIVRAVRHMRRGPTRL